MSKINLNELSAILVDKHGLSKKEAQQFIASMVDVIRDGISQDRLVKVKGLGTFKIVDVGARESVNVNTGERVVINSHSKLTFTPDAAMKDLVNKPFSQFETVVLNEGVNFADESDESESGNIEDEATVPVDVPVEVNSITETEESPVDETPSTITFVEENAEEVKQETKSDNSVHDVATKLYEAAEEKPEDISPMTFEDSETTSSHSKKRWMLWIPIVVLLSGLCFALGYYLGSNHHDAPIIIPTKASIVSPDTISSKNKIIEIKEAKLDSVRKASKNTVKEPNDEVSIKTDDELNKETIVKEESTKSLEPEYKKYEAMDQRVRLGAYIIVGLDHVEKVKEGDTFYRISRRALGPGMECYIEVYNGIKSTDPIKVGQSIKIPKLKVKDAARQKFRK